jgi:hypothetical protein
MQSSLPRTLIRTALAVGLALTAPAWAESVTYPGATLLDLSGCPRQNNTLAPAGSDAPGCKSTSLSGNTVELDSYTNPPDTTVSDVYGAFSTADATAITSNQVSVDGHAVTAVVGGELDYIGNAPKANVSVSGNGVTLKANADIGESFGADAYNRTTGNSEAKNNSVTMNGGTVQFYLIGGQAGSSTGAAEAQLNSVTVNGGLVKTDVEGGDAYYNFSGGSASAHDNTATLAGGEVQGDIEGAYSDNNAANNHAVISGGTADGNVYAAYIHGDSAGDGASANDVTISGASTVDGSVYGGFVKNAGSAANNHVIISGGALNADIYAAWINGASAGDSVNNNDVTISGAPSLGGGLYGGHVDSGVGTASGNTLNLHSAGIDASNLREFQNLHFYLPPGLDNTGTAPMLKVSSIADISNARIQASLEGAGPTLHTGDKYMLLWVLETLNATGIAPLTGTLGGFNYTVSVETSIPGMDGQALMLTIGNRVPPSVPAPAIGYGGLLALGLLFTVSAGAWLRGTRR